MKLLTPERGALAVARWEEVRERLPVPVILAENALTAYSHKPVLHILALQDLVRRGRPLTGLDVYYVNAAEACFCGNPNNLRNLQFHVWRARHNQHRYPYPTCTMCLRMVKSITGLDVDVMQHWTRNG